MNRLGKIVLFFIFLLFTIPPGLAQDIPRQKDTLQSTVNSDESDKEIKEQSEKGNENKQSGISEQENNSGKIKRIKEGRPDMSRSSGARPPSVVRPSGSSVPKGIGKPGGAGRHGGR